MGHRHTGYLGQALHGYIPIGEQCKTIVFVAENVVHTKSNWISPEHRDSEELEDESLDELGLEDVPKGDPVEELQQGV